MTTDPSRDPNESAADAVRRAMGEDEPLPPGLEAAWEAWSKSIKGVDERVLELLRAAFEAGVEAAEKNAAAEMGRKGGLKGGKARAEKLSPAKRKAIAKKAAKKRWGD